jgi:phage terminase small subunit
MPVLHNERHERFAQALASGRLTAGKAYVSVGYSEKGAAVSASSLRRNAQVAARIQELLTNQAAEMIAQMSRRR